MKKVGILTFHCADNYGAVLQCLGLQEFLIRQGYDVRIINYHPKYLLDKHSLIVNPLVRFKEYKKLDLSMNVIMKKTGRSVLENIYLFKRLVRKNKFSSYRKKYLKETGKVFNYNEIDYIAGDFDILICGSDQIWNKKMSNNEFDKVFFLKFNSKKVKRISYAASAGSIIDNKDKSEFIYLLNDFDNISVREEKLLNQVQAWSNKEAKLVLDPSMLLTGEEWNNYIDEKIIKEKYILVYSLEKNENLINIINKVYEKINIKVIEIDMRKRLKIKGKCISTLNPGEFLSLVRNSEFIITNSFHGTVFSILFHKRFISVPHLTLGERMRTLLSILDLEDRMVIDENMLDNALIEIDYEDVDKKLQILRNNSIDFLTNAIVGE